jgi:hypothetical protein
MYPTHRRFQVGLASTIQRNLLSGGYIPSKLPQNIHMVVSSTCASGRNDLGTNLKQTSEHFRKEQVKTQHICGEITRRNWLVLVMDPLSEENVRAVAAKHLSLHNDIEEHDEIVDFMFTSQRKQPIIPHGFASGTI